MSYIWFQMVDVRLIHRPSNPQENAVMEMSCKIFEYITGDMNPF
jgi:hypothetical protein